MTVDAPSLFDTLERPVPAGGPTGDQHDQVLLALYDAGPRGMTGEEAATYCDLRDAHIATTRFSEMAGMVPRLRERFPVPFVYRSEKRERKTASGVSAYVWWLTEEGRRFVAAEMQRSEG